jgi:hypothetical protein
VRSKEKMYSTNNYNSEQNYIYCGNNCGAKITFSDNVTSKSGRKIPLQENGLPHDCPYSSYNKAKATAVEKREVRRKPEFQIIEDLKNKVAAINNGLEHYGVKLIVNFKE